MLEETARSAFYPEQLCQAIHDGLDAHESALAASTLEEKVLGHSAEEKAKLPCFYESGGGGGGSAGDAAEARSGCEVRPQPHPTSGPREQHCSGSLAAPQGPGWGPGTGRRAPEPDSGTGSLPPGSVHLRGSPAQPAAAAPQKQRLECLDAGNQPSVILVDKPENESKKASVSLQDPSFGPADLDLVLESSGMMMSSTGNQPSGVNADNDKPKNENKKASVEQRAPLFGPDAPDPNWELFCLEHGMHELAQDDGPSEPASAHRPKNGLALGLFTAMVTRIIPASSPEAKSEGCLQALLKETTKLRSRTVWDESAVDEWSNVRKRDPTASCGRVFSILGEKNAERHAPEAEREYKARIAFAGNAIQTASGVAPHELFQEVSSAPAAMASIRAVLAVSALRGWSVKARDAAQAYIQARIDGPGRPKTWVRLPKSWWPKTWFTASGEPKYWDPVCPLQRALYGHPESGAIWEKHLASILEELGWERVRAHPGTWVHRETLALLAVYVDDLLLTAPPAHEKRLWRALEQRVKFDEEPSELSKFLGAHHNLTKRGNMTSGKVQMREFLQDAVSRYMEETGERALAAVRTPYLPENFSPKGGEEPGAQIGRAHV